MGENKTGRKRVSKKTSSAKNRVGNALSKIGNIKVGKYVKTHKREIAKAAYYVAIYGYTLSMFASPATFKLGAKIVKNLPRGIKSIPKVYSNYRWAKDFKGWYDPDRLQRMLR